jgi:phage terminase small subunit
MKCGPKKTPTKTLEDRGSWLAKTRNGTEPEYDDSVPVCPDFLDDIAKKEWNRLVPLLTSAGVLKTTDRNALARYCVLWSKFVLLQKPGLGDLGDLKKIDDSMRKLEACFGLTPADRSNVKVNKKLDKNDKKSYFRAG